jgi:hypothetical protein
MPALTAPLFDDASADRSKLPSNCPIFAIDMDLADAKMMLAGQA